MAKGDYENALHKMQIFAQYESKIVRLAKLSRTRDYIVPKTRILNVEMGIIWNFCNDSIAKSLNCNWKGTKVTL